MTRGKIIVETSRLDSTAEQVESLADTYENEYGALYNTVKELQNSYSGEDSDAFVNQIEGFRDDFQRMTQLMREYAEFLRKAAAAYRETQDSITAKAKTLEQGN